jgi:hypothetical protein
MSDDNKVEIRYTANTSDAIAGSRAVANEVGNTTNAVGGSITELSGHANRGAFAMKGFHFASHELFAELGMGGRMARAFGHEVQTLAGTLGSIASVMGGVALAVVAGYQVFEHFTKAAEEKKKAIDASIASLENEVNSLYRNTEQTAGMTRATYNLLEAKRALLILDLRGKIDEDTEALKKQTEETEKNARARQNAQKWWGAGLDISGTADMGSAPDKMVEKHEKDNAREAQTLKVTQAQIEARKALLKQLEDINPSYANYSEKKDNSKDKSRMAEWEQTLKDSYQKDIENKGHYFEQSKSEELKYFQNILSGQKTTDAEKAQLAKRITDLKIQISKEGEAEEIGAMKFMLEQYKKGSQERIDMAKEVEKEEAKSGNNDKYLAAVKARIDAEKEYAEEKGKLDDAILERERQIERHSVDMKKEDLNTLVALGKISKEEELLALIEFENKSWIAQVKALNDEKANLAEGTAAYAEHMNKRLKLAQQHDLEIKKLNDKTRIETDATWNRMLQPMTTGFNSMVMGMLNRTMTLRQGLRNIGLNIASDFLTNVVMKGVTNWIKGELEKLATSRTISGMLQVLGITQAAQQEATQTTTTTTAIVEAKAMALAMIPAYTGIAAIGAASAMADIPYVGPVLGAAAFAEMMALGAGALAYGLSAEGGFDIPSNINPIVQTHAREMILPADIADHVRSSMGAGTQAPSASPTFTLGRGSKLTDLITLKDHKKAFERLVRDYHLKPRKA